ncbi:fatty acid desaturase family protein [Paraliomyxa miuraensis]|uniref:fatty acid desaturase family protein n=1 Tax=Paraliomyxa miuraensis TaxID=376150 RepID=UPI00224E63BD|nr:acyl-CoA desaturase [Paraliomyxa miuraensis]MCX4241913.1 acyl-CoA desaturase [Paraliomyxa miuraensis]
MRDARISFVPRSAFHRQLVARVDDHFERTGLPRDGGSAIVRKTLVLLATLGAGYFALLLGDLGWPGLVVAALVAGIAVAGLGMAVMHDGSHGAYASSARGNLLAARVLDFLGCSSYVWKVKHVHVHHTYPNIEGADDDIALEPLARFAPGQPHHAAHRFQHLYMFFLYGFVIMKWWIIDDFKQLARGRIGRQPLAAPRGEEAAVFWSFKIIHGIWAVLIPGLVVGWLPTLAFYVISQYTAGLILSLVFQLAHSVEEAEFLDPEASDGKLELDFARLQLATTVDFAPRSRWLSWYVGGLNFQAIHHLFPRVSHVHYPALAPIVSQVCAEHGVEYKVRDSALSLLRSHYRWLRRMGRKPETTPEDQALPLPRAA